jgi:hypothetical protein
LKRILSVITAAFAASMAVAVAASAAPAPKATGDYGYSFGGVQRHVTFSAIQSTDTCGTFWNVAGVSSFDFTLNNDPTPGTHYVHAASLAQAGQSVSGSGGYPQSGPFQFSWHITSGSVVGNTLNLTVVYDSDASAIGTVMNMTGTIAANGSISGTWNDNYQGATRTGNFTASGATGIPYCGKGTFSYTDQNGAWYLGVVKSVNVSDPNAWYAVQILASNLNYEQNNYWLAVKVTDNAEPGVGKDVTGGDLTDQTTALYDVAHMVTPSTSAVINQGNIQVH